MLYICAKFHEIISNGIKVIKWTQFLYGKLQRGIILPKMQVEQLLLISARRLSCLVLWNYLERYRNYRVDTISILKITKGNNLAKNVGGVTVFNLCTSSVMLYISTKFCEIISNGIKVIEQTWFLYWKLQRGIIPQKNVGGVTVVNLCTSSSHALYFYQVFGNYLERYQSYRADTISILKISKGNNSAKNVGGVTVVNLCTSSDHALYLCQVSWNYLKRYQSYGADTNDQPLTDGQTLKSSEGIT